MAVTLPTSPGYASASPFMVDYGSNQRSALGGVTQRVNRLGNRFGLSVELPPMANGETAAAWIAALNLGLTEGVITRWPLHGIVPGTTGTPLVNGAGQSGMALVIDGAEASYPFKAGQFFSILTGSRHYLHQVYGATTLSGAGAGSLPILPELRVSPADNAPLHVSQPMIQGLLEGDGREWTIDRARMVGLSFAVIEAR